MTVLVDSTVLIDALRRYDPAMAFLGEVRTLQPVRASVLSRFEVRSGEHGGSSEVDEFTQQVVWEPITHDVADRAGAFARMYRKSNPAIDPVDYLIAATADVYGLELATKNVRHFPMFPGLVAPY